MAIELSEWHTDSMSDEAALAAANIHINGITPVNTWDLTYKYQIDRSHYGSTSTPVVNVAVSYEFQWKNRGNYIWERMSDIFAVSAGISATEAFTEEELTRANGGWKQIVAPSMDSIYEQIYRKVIQFREELEDPDDRGKYTYYLSEEDVED